MSSQSTYENIEAYLDGTLTGDQLKAFEEQLQSDKELASQLALFQNVDQAIGDKATLNFQKMVAAQGEKFLHNTSGQVKNESKVIRFSRPWAIAAALLALIVSAMIFWNIQSADPPSTEALFAQNFETYPLNQSVRGGSTDNSVLKIGVQQYQGKDYLAAAQTFEPLAQADQSDMLVAFCLANAYLNQEPPQFDFAKRELQRIIDDGVNIYVLRAKWYLALIFLKEGNIEKTKSLLKAVAQSGDSLGQKAKTLLKDL